MMLYVLAFCRIVIGIVFAISFLRKVGNVPVFEQTITQFSILPKRFSRLVALLLLSGEIAVVFLVTMGGSFLEPGFLLSILLLLLFSSALVSVLHRNIQTPCNCFGLAQKRVSPIDIWRNIGFIVCALIGCSTLAVSNSGQEQLAPLEWGLLGLAVAFFVALWLHLGEIVQLFQ
jgi:hypothetical protein